MPTPAPAIPPNRSLTPGPFADRLAAFLMPYWAGVTKDYDLARADMEATIASYGAQTRAGLINAVQIIANSFAALEMLARVKIQEQDLSATQHLRYRSCANSLSRACHYAQNALDRRLACDSPGARKPTPQPPAEPPADISDQDAAEMLRHTQAAIDACRNRLANAQPPTRPDGTLNFPPDRSQRRSASAIMQALSAGGPPKAAMGSATAAAAAGS